MTNEYFERDGKKFRFPNNLLIMKYILLLLFPITLLAQNVEIATITGSAQLKLMPLKLGKVVDSLVSSGGESVYLFESNVQGANAPNSKVRALIIQVPMSVEITPAEVGQLESLVTSISGTAPAETIVTNIDNVPDLILAGQLINTYEPAWIHANVQGHFSNTISFSNEVGATLETKFSGQTIQWIAEKKSTHGIAEVYIDNVLQTKVDLYSPTEQKGVFLFSKSGLSPGIHTIKIRVTGTKRAESTGTYIVHDRFKSILVP